MGGNIGQLSLQGILVRLLRHGLPLAVAFLLICSQARSQPAPTKPGTVFSDGASFPQMVVIPPGQIFIGTPTPDEMRWHPPSTPPIPPPHLIQFAQPFAIAKYPVTFGEWNACIAAGGCNGYTPPPGYLQAPITDDPVVNVSWRDAQAYVAWLNSMAQKCQIASNRDPLFAFNTDPC